MRQCSTPSSPSPAKSDAEVLPDSCPPGADPTAGQAAVTLAGLIKSNCGCTDRKVGFSFLVLALILLATVHALVLFFRGVRISRAFLQQKVQLRADVQTHSQTASKLISTATSPLTDNAMPTGDDWQAVWDWADALERTRRGDEGHYLLADTEGQVYATGSPDSLTVRNGRADAPASARMIPAAARGPIMDAAASGGRFGYFTDSADRMWVAYAQRVPQTPFLLAALEPVPAHSQARARLLHTAQEQRNAPTPTTATAPRQTLHDDSAYIRIFRMN